jgi:hypothetical protein
VRAWPERAREEKRLPRGKGRVREGKGVPKVTWSSEGQASQSQSQSQSETPAKHTHDSCNLTTALHSAEGHVGFSCRGRVPYHTYSNALFRSACLSRPRHPSGRAAYCSPFYHLGILAPISPPPTTTATAPTIKSAALKTTTNRPHMNQLVQLPPADHMHAFPAPRRDPFHPSAI